MKHTRWREINEVLTFTLFRYIAIIPVDGKDMAITRSENSKKRIDNYHNLIMKHSSISSCKNTNRLHERNYFKTWKAFSFINQSMFS